MKNKDKMKNSIEAAYKAYPLTDENKNNTNINAKRVGFQQGYEQAEQDLKLKWIDVKDELPKENGKYLTLNANCSPDAGTCDWDADKKYWYTDICEQRFIHERTHWMNIPKLKKEGEI